MTTFWDFVDRRGPDECWPWMRCVMSTGYAQTSVHGNRLVHRLVYEEVYGPIPPGANIDHTCHNEDRTCPGGRSCLHRRCCNPRHLEAVTPLVNTQRGNERAGRGLAKTHCVHGHEFTPENTWWGVWKGRPTRKCRACNRNRQAARKARLRAA